MRSKTACVAAVIGLAMAAAVDAKTTKTVQVDCTKGESVNAALTAKADELVIEISGVCSEDVEVRRDNVVLIGKTGPGVDGINAVDTADALGAAIEVRATHGVRIENLTLSGGNHSGLLVRNAGSEMRVVNCRLEGNGVRGASFVGAFVTLEDTVVTGNGALATTVFGSAGLLATGASGIRCTNCTIDTNPVIGRGVGVYALRGSTITVVNSTVSGLIAAATDVGADVTAFDSTLIGELNTDGGSLDGFGWAAYSDHNSLINLVRVTAENSLWVENKSQLVLINVDQTTNASLGENFANRDSQLETLSSGGGSTTLLGSTTLFRFSTGVFRGATTLGDLGCDAGSDATCDGAVVKTSSSCGLCP